MTTHRRRPRRLIATLATAALTLLAGCGGASSDASAGGAEGGDTYTVHNTFNGDVSGVPKHPKRVVALWRTGTELADMGVTPVGALEDEFLPGELDAKTYARVKDVPTVGTWQGVDIEKVIKVRPDLIVGMDNGGLGIDYDELSQVAPTVIFKIAEPPDVWRNYPRLARVLGKSTDFHDRNAALDRRLAGIRQRYGERIADAKAVALSADAGDTWVATSKALNVQRIRAAGFDYLERYRKRPERFAEELSTENLPRLSDADVIFYTVDLRGKPTPDMARLLREESFRRLPAVRAGNLFPLTSGTIFSFPAGDRQVDDLTRAARALTPVDRG